MTDSLKYMFNFGYFKNVFQWKPSLNDHQFENYPSLLSNVLNLYENLIYPQLQPNKNPLLVINEWEATVEKVEIFYRLR